ncbi:hypothetical protein ABEY43_06660 [Priestia megaterium]
MISSIIEIATILNNRKLLLNFSLENKENRVVLHIETDNATARYSVRDNKEMNSFIESLEQHMNNKEELKPLIRSVY